MYNKAIEVLNVFYNHGYNAYIVGGYPRDYLLGIDTKDIDISTNALPKDIMVIFGKDNVIDCGYGAVKLIYKKCLFDVTTFRKDIKYEDNRKPVKIKYIKDIKKDLLRRDFTINTICIDKDGLFLDLLDAKKDIDLKIIKTVGNPKYRIKEDVLRILRAIRFASNLNFIIDNKTKKYIIKNGYLLNKLSSSRKKEELSKIFSLKNKEVGRKYLVEFGMDKYLGLKNLDKIVLCDDIIGIWSQLEFDCEYDFSKLEMSQIKKIREMLNKEINSYNVYKYGLYISTVVGSIKGISYLEINDIYKNLVINSRSDIVVNGKDIIQYLNKKPGKYISDIIDDIEEKILLGELNNNKEDIYSYIGGKYGDI